MKFGSDGVLNNQNKMIDANRAETFSRLLHNFPERLYFLEKMDLWIEKLLALRFK